CPSGVLAVMPAEKDRQLADVRAGLRQPVSGVMPTQRQYENRKPRCHNELQQSTPEQTHGSGAAAPVPARERMPGKILPAPQSTTQQPFQGESCLLDRLVNNGLIAQDDSRT